MQDPLAKARSALEAAARYVRSNHNANGRYWNDPAAWDLIEHVIKPALAELPKSP